MVSSLMRSKGGKVQDERRRYAARRRTVLREARKQKPIDAFLATSPTDIRYLCGALEGSQTLLFGDDWAVVMTRRMYQHVLPEQCPGVEVILTDGPDLSRSPEDEKTLAAQLRHRRIKRLGFDPTTVSVARYEKLTSHVSKQRLVPFRGLVQQVRAIKDEQEIALTRKAVQIAEQAFRQLLARGADYLLDQTERQLAADLEYAMRQLGADRQGFQLNDIIVAAGPHSASCHHRPTERKVQPGEPLLFDWGAELDGYRSDITRVAFVREVADPFVEIYGAVERALQEATQRLRPGVMCRTVDRAARKVLDDLGWGDRFIHGLGHGIGLEIHEEPRLTTSPQLRLRRNMILTIEPGVYLKGTGGVRLENDLLITADGCENLCSLPTRLQEAIIR